MLFLPRILFFGFALLLLGLASCTQPVQVDKAQWEGLSQPGDTVVAYVEALKAKNIDRALGYLYLPKERDLTMLTNAYQAVAMKVVREDWKVRIKETLEHNRFAAVIYTTREDGSDPEPMLVARDDAGYWRLYHHAIAGRLAKYFKGRDLDDAEFVVRKGQERMTELRTARQRRLDSGPETPPAESE